MSPTAADGVQQCMSAMQGDLEASQEGQEEGGGSGQLDPARLNLLYCYSVSCPLLTEDDESGMSGPLSLYTRARVGFGCNGPSYSTILPFDLTQVLGVKSQ